MPGTDPAEAMRIVLGELPDLPHLAELPARGAGAGLTGRTAALLVELPVETTSTGWRFAGRPGRDLSRARGLLSADRILVLRLFGPLQCVVNQAHTLILPSNSRIARPTMR